MRKKIKLAAGALGAIVLLTVCCMVFLWFGLKDKPSEITVNVLKGDIGMLDGFSIETGYTEFIETKENEFANSAIMSECRATQTVDFKGDKATVTWGYRKNEETEQEIKELSGKVEYEYPKGTKGEIFLVTSNLMKADFCGYNGEASIRIEDYVTFELNDRFLYFTYESDSAEYTYEMKDRTQYFSHSNMRSMVTFEEGDYGYIDVEPELYYTCTCDYKGVGGASDYLEWTTEEAIKNMHNEAYVIALEKFGPPEYHMMVKKGLYLFGEDGTPEYVYPMDDRMEGFEYKQIAGCEEEGTIFLFGVQENQAVVFVYTVATGEMNRVVLWENFGELGGYALSLDGAQITFFMASKEWKYCTVVMRMNSDGEIIAVQENVPIQLYDSVYSSVYSENGFMDDFICDVDVYVDDNRIYVGEMRGRYAEDEAWYRTSILENDEVIFWAEMTLTTGAAQKEGVSMFGKVTPVNERSYGQRTIKLMKEN